MSLKREVERMINNTMKKKNGLDLMPYVFFVVNLKVTRRDIRSSIFQHASETRRRRRTY